MQMCLLIFTLCTSFSISTMSMVPDYVSEIIKSATSENGKELDFAKQGIDDASLKEIFAYIKKQQEISRLDSNKEQQKISQLNLSFNKIQDAGVFELIEFLRQNYSIKKLFIEHNDYIKSNWSDELVDELRFVTLRNQKLFEIFHDEVKASALLQSLKGNFPGDIVSLILIKYLETMMYGQEKYNLGKFVSIPGGRHRVSSSLFKREEKQILVDIEPYDIQEKTVDQGYFMQEMGYNPAFQSTRESCPLNWKPVESGEKGNGVCIGFPVTDLTLSMIKEFLARINRDPKYAYRLPTSLELEIIGAHDRAFLSKNLYPVRKSRTYPVTFGTKNDFGIYPSSVAEWAQQEYEIIAGGQGDAQAGWIAFGSYGNSTGRYRINPKKPDRFLGIRLVRYAKHPKAKGFVESCVQKYRKTKAKIKNHNKPLKNP